MLLLIAAPAAAAVAANAPTGVVVRTAALVIAELERTPQVPTGQIICWRRESRKSTPKRAVIPEPGADGEERAVWRPVVEIELLGLIVDRLMKGFLNDGPAAGQVVEVGDPPVRRGVIVLDAGGFGEDAHRHYLSGLDSSGAVYTHWGRVAWPPEAGPPVIRQPVTEGVENT